MDTLSKISFKFLLTKVSTPGKISIIEKDSAGSHQNIARIFAQHGINLDCVDDADSFNAYITILAKDKIKELSFKKGRVLQFSYEVVEKLAIDPELEHTWHSKSLRSLDFTDKTFIFPKYSCSTQFRTDKTIVVQLNNGSVLPSSTFAKADVIVIEETTKPFWKQFDDLTRFILYRSQGAFVVSHHWWNGIGTLPFEEFFTKKSTRKLVGIPFYGVRDPIISSTIRRHGGVILPLPNHPCLTFYEEDFKDKLLPKHKVVEIAWLRDSIVNKFVVNSQNYLVEHNSSEPHLEISKVLAKNEKVFFTPSILSRDAGNLKKYSALKCNCPNDAKYFVDRFIREMTNEVSSNDSVTKVTTLCLEKLVNERSHVCALSHSTIYVCKENIDIFSSKSFVLLIEDQDLRHVIENILMDCSAIILQPRSFQVGTKCKASMDLPFVIWDNITENVLARQMLRYGYKIVNMDIFFHLLTRPLVPHQLKKMQYMSADFRDKNPHDAEINLDETVAERSGPFTTVCPPKLLEVGQSDEEGRHLVGDLLHASSGHLVEDQLDEEDGLRDLLDVSEDDLVEDHPAAEKDKKSFSDIEDCRKSCDLSSDDEGLTNQNEIDELNANESTKSNLRQFNFPSALNTLYMEKKVESMLSDLFCSMQIRNVSTSAFSDFLFDVVGNNISPDKGVYCSWLNNGTDNSAVFFKAIFPNDDNVENNITSTLGELFQLLILPLVVSEGDNKLLFFSRSFDDSGMTLVAEMVRRSTIFKLDVYHKLNDLVVRNRPISRCVMETEVILKVDHPEVHRKGSHTYYPYRVVPIRPTDKVDEIIHAACVTMSEDSSCVVHVNGTEDRVEEHFSEHTIPNACHAYSTVAAKHIPPPIVYCNRHAFEKLNGTRYKLTSNQKFDCYQTKCQTPPIFLMESSS